MSVYIIIAAAVIVPIALKFFVSNNVERRRWLKSLRAVHPSSEDQA